MTDETTPNEPGPDDQTPRGQHSPLPPTSPPPEAYRFDPMTGRPLHREGAQPPFAFDPMTGRPLDPPPVDGTQKRKQSRTRLVIAAVAALVLIGAGTAAAFALSGPSQLEQDQEACTAALGDYLEALDTVDSRLDVGVNISAYSEVVGAASVARDHVDEDARVLDEVDFCKSAFEGANVAMVSYSLIASTWNDCIFEDSCDPDTDLDLPNSWGENSKTLDAVNEAIDEGKPIDPDSDVGERIEMLTRLGFADS